MTAGSIIAAVFATVIGLAFVLAGGLVIVLGFSATTDSGDPAPWYVFVPFGLVFVGVGSLVIWAGLRTPGEAARAAREKKKYSAEPWKQVKEWRTNLVKDDAGRGTWFFWGFALFWNAIIASVLGVGWKNILEQAEGKPASLLILVFPLVGIGLLTVAIRRTIRARMFPPSELVLSMMPIPPGGALSGTLKLPESLRNAERIVIRLSCFRITRSGKNSHTTILWQDDHERSGMDLTSDGVNALLPLHIDIPGNAQISTFDGGTPRIVWQLDVNAPVPGVDYHSSFKVPVYGSVARQDNTGSDLRMVTDSSARPVRPDSKSVSRTVPMAMSPDGGMEWDFRPLRLPGPTLAVTVITVIWLGVTLFLGLARDVPIMFPIVFGFFGLLLLYGMYDLWLARIILQVRDAALIRRTGPIVTIRFYRCGRNDISDFTVRPGMSMGSRAYHDIYVTLKSGKKLRIGSHLRSLREAEMIVQEVKEALGMTEG